MIAAIPTPYKGVQMRSRLEARWAAFFDLLGWEWHYEPFDLQGWIPDFALGPDLTTAALVEVKPIDWGGRPSIGSSLNHPGPHEREIVHAAEQAPGSCRGVLICGLRPIWDDLRSVLSWSIGPVYEPALKRWMVPHASRERATGVMDFSVGHGEPYLGLATGRDYTFDDRIEEYVGDLDARSLWTQAGNRVQWRAPR